VLTARSHLFVPGIRADLMAKADRGPADVVVVDLEDAVPVPRKDEARDALARWVGTAPASPVWVRLNAGDGARNVVRDPHRRGVGQVVRDVVDVLLLHLHAGRSRVECSGHWLLL
jgi:citrate lyase beta subunit